MIEHNSSKKRPTTMVFRRIWMLRLFLQRLLIVLVFAILLYAGIQESQRQTVKKKIKDTQCKTYTREGSVDFFRDIARQLLELSRQLQNEVKNISSSILRELHDVASELDPRFGLSSGRLPKPPHPVPDVCDEIYLGPTFGFPKYREGFVQSPKCIESDKKKLTDLITILVLDHNVEINKTKHLIMSIRAYNPNIELIFSSTYVLDGTFSKTEYGSNTFKRSAKENNDIVGNILNYMIKSVKTPYVLVGRDLFYFNDLAKIERQIFAISRTREIGVAGGAYRNETGYWKVGCFLSRMRNYFLKYTEGYMYSELDCMFCDHLEGPFVTKTSLLTKISFRDLPDSVVFEDWFLRVKEKKILTVNCPDAMYFKSGPIENELREKSTEAKAWLLLASFWKINQIFYPSRISVKYTCAMLGIKCNATWWIQGLLIPPCCMEQITRALEALHTFTEERGYDYEIESGTLLGSVKFNHFLPWDNDIDVSFPAAERNIYSQYDNYFKERNIISISSRTFLLTYRVPEIKLEMHGLEQMSSSESPVEFIHTPTLVQFNGIWLRGKWNPGMYLKKRYGDDFLKHSHKLRDTKLGRYRRESNFNREKFCPESNHHACIDQYPTDGNIEFGKSFCEADIT